MWLKQANKQTKKEPAGQQGMKRSHVVSEVPSEDKGFM